MIGVHSDRMFLSWSKGRVTTSGYSYVLKNPLKAVKYAKKHGHRKELYEAALRDNHTAYTYALDVVGEDEKIYQLLLSDPHWLFHYVRNVMGNRGAAYSRNPRQYTQELLNAISKDERATKWYFEDIVKYHDNALYTEKK